MKSIKKIFDAVENVIKAVCCSLVCGFTVMTLISVIARYVLHAPIWWSEQFCRYLFIWMLMMYAPLIVRKGKNLGFDLVVTKLPYMVQEILQLICEILIGLFGAVVVPFEPRSGNVSYNGTYHMYPSFRVLFTYL